MALDPGTYRFYDIKQDFRAQTTFGLGLVALLVIFPFAINNFLQGRPILGIGSLAVVALIGINSWCISRGRFWPSLNFYGLAPIFIILLVYVMTQQGIIAILWSYPALLTLYCILPEKKAWIANSLLLIAMLWMSWTHMEYAVAIRATATLITVSAISALFIRIIEAQQMKLEEQIITDPLTGLYNRLLLKKTLEQAIKQRDRAQISMTLLAMDIDDFKKINDSLGHDAGDAVLVGIGKLLHKRLRGTDWAFRVGGEEFIVLLYGTDHVTATQVAEEIRALVSSAPLLLSQSVTISIGIATLQEEDNWTSWSKRADTNLYRSKASGKNRVSS